MAGLIKKFFPKCKIYFLGRSYTQDIIAMSEHVDEFINYDEQESMPESLRISFLKKLNADVFVHVFPRKEIALLARKAGIKHRIGTTNRLYHWFTCNTLVLLSRKNSELHEAQLNFKLLDFLKINTSIDLNEIPSYYGFTKLPLLDKINSDLIEKDKFNLILHPKSKGSAREWGIDNYRELVKILPADKFKIFVTGTAQEASLMSDFLQEPGVHDLTGKLSLNQLIAFIQNCDGLLAASTGPLHIAAALNKKAIGLFVPKRPMHPGRWQPLGNDAHVLVFDENCESCKNGKECNCITKISPKQVLDLLTDK